MRAALIDIGMVCVRLDASTGLRIRDADGGLRTVHGKAVGAGIGTEIRVKRAILLQNDDHVADLVNPGRARSWRRLATRAEQRQHQCDC